MITEPENGSLFWRTVWALVWKDLRLERNTGQTLSIMIFFGITAVVIFSLASFQPTSAGSSTAVRTVSAGFLWVTIVLSGTLGLNRSFSAEQENRSLDALLVAPLDRSALFLGKVISIFLFALAFDLVLALVFSGIFNRPFIAPAVLGLLALGTLGFVAAGVLITAMTIQTRARAVLLPVLLLPLSIPAVLAASVATTTLINEAAPSWEQIGFPVALVLFYDVLMLIVGWFTFQYVVEE